MIRILVGDLASVEADAVVRPTTTTFAPFPGNPSTLEQAAVDVLPRLDRTGERLGLGAAIVTTAAGLSCDYLIHVAVAAAGPASPISVERATLSVLQRASDWHFATLALPPIGAGPDHLVMETTAEIILSVLFEYLKEQAYPTDVHIVVGKQGDKVIFDNQISSQES